MRDTHSIDSVVIGAGVVGLAVARALAHAGREVVVLEAAETIGSSTIYPLPDDDAGLGVHLTLDLAGQARFGPDTEWIDTIDYRVDERRAAPFAAAIRRWWPALPDGALQPAYAGIRPKLVGPGEPAADFVIQGPHEHGVPGWVNLFGIESPGLTAALAIGGEVLRKLNA